MFKGDKSANKKIERIVKELSSHSVQKSHSRHISLKKIKELGLKVFDLGEDKDLQNKVLSVHHSTIITLSQSPAYKIIENDHGKVFIQQYNKSIHSKLIRK